MLRVIVTSLLLLFSALASPAPANVPAPKILILGDSLSAGYGIGKEQSWPALLAQRLREEAYPHQIVNISISGETTRGGLSRLDKALAEQRPAIVILALGANDGLRGLPIAQMRDNLAAMIRQSQARQARVLLVGMRLPPNYGVDYETQFAAAYAELAKQYKVALLPFLFAGFAEQRAAFQADGLHPAAASQPLMQENVWRALQPILKRP